jgi:WD40 repeat protein
VSLPRDELVARWLLDARRATPDQLLELKAEQARRGGTALVHLAIEYRLLSQHELAEWLSSSGSGSGSGRSAARTHAGASLSDGATRGGGSLSGAATRAGGSAVPRASDSGRLSAQLPEDVQRAIAAGRPRLDKYVLVKELGRGAMGVVHLGYDTALHRRVAIKQLISLPGVSEASRAVGRERFVREGRAVARLEHANIVAVLEVGEHEGQPYLVMSLVEGCDLAELLERESLTVREVTALVQQVAQALGHAHAHGIVHRDVKPANVLVDEGRRALLSDFGLARDVETGSELSRTGDILGTPLYLSPEQAAGKQSEVQAPSDVFSLGGVLYRCLTGEPPFEAGDGLLPLVNRIVSVEPRAPRELRPQIPRDLQNVILKCLEKEPQRRYPDGAAIAEELRRFLDGEAVEARPLSRAERWTRAARRNKLLATTVVAAGLTILGLLVAGVVGALYSVQRIREERDLADERRVQAEVAQASETEARRQEERQRKSAERARADAVAAGERVQEESAAKDRQLAIALREKAERLARDLRHGEAAALFAASMRLQPSPEARSGLLRVFLELRPQVAAPWPQRVTDLALFGQRPVISTTRTGLSVLLTLDEQSTGGDSPALSSEVKGGAWAVATDPKRGWIAEGDLLGSLRVWSLGERKQVASTREAHGGAVVGLAFTPAGALVSASLDGTLGEWRVEGSTLRRQRTLRVLNQRPLDLAVAGDDIACVTDAGRLLVWSAEGESPSVDVQAHPGWCRALAPGPQGTWLTAGLDGRARIWSAAGEPLAELVVGPPLTAIASAWEGRVAVGTAAGRTEMWHVERRKRIERFQDHDGPVMALAVRADERLLVSASWTGMVMQQRWTDSEHLNSGALKQSHRLQAVALDGRGKTLVAVDEFGSLCLFQPEGESAPTTYRSSLTTPLDRIALDPKRSQVVAGGQAPSLLSVDLATKQGGPVELHRARISALSFAEDGRLLSADESGRVYRWNLSAGKAGVLKDLGKPIRHAVQDETSHRLAVVLADGSLKVWEDKRLLADLPGCTGRPAFTQSGGYLLFPRDRELLMWHAEKGGLKRLGEEGAAIRALALPRKGLHGLVIREDGLVSLWDLQDFRAAARWPCVVDAGPDVAAISFTSNRAVAVGSDGSARVWATTPQSFGARFSYPSQVKLTTNLVLAEGQLLAGCSDSKIRAWNPDTGKMRPRLLSLSAPHLLLATPDGRWLFAGSDASIYAKQKGKPAFEISLESRPHSLCYDSRSQRLYVGFSSNERIQRVDLERRAFDLSWKAMALGGGVYALALRGRTLAAGTIRGGVVLYELPAVAKRPSPTQGERTPVKEEGGISLLKPFNVGGALYRTVALTFGSAGELFVAAERRSGGAFDSRLGGGSQVWRYDPQTEELRLLNHSRDHVRGMTLSPNGRWLAVSGTRTRLFDARSGALLCELPAPGRHVGLGGVFASSSRYVSQWAPGQLRVWDLEELPVHESPEEVVERVWRSTGYRVLAGQVVHVRHAAEFEFLQALQRARR